MTKINYKQPSQRQLRVANEIRQALASIFLNVELYSPGVVFDSISISTVKVSSDLRIVSVFIITRESEKSKIMIKAINDLLPQIRSLLIKQVKLRYAPELRFFPDTSLEKAVNEEKLLNLIRIANKSE